MTTTQAWMHGDNGAVGRTPGEHVGRRPLLLVGFTALPVRALVFGWTTNPTILIVAQLPDGVSGTMLGVLTALITHPANGSEHL